LNSFRYSRVHTSNVWVELGPTEDFAVEWDTNVPATAQIWWRPPPQLPGYYSPLDTGPSIRHRREGNFGFHQTDYEVEIRSTAPDRADACDGPVRFISGPLAVRVEEVGRTWARIEWETSLPFDSGVLYGPTPEYGEMERDGTLTTDHSVMLVDLTPAQTYHFRVCYTAPGYAEHRSVDYTFKTGPWGFPAAVMVSH
jgi:hypothetical protein